VIRIGFIRLNHREYGVRGNKAAEIINVAVSVVADDSFAQPDHVPNAEIVGKHTLVIAAAEARITLLDFAE